MHVYVWISYEKNVIELKWNVHLIHLLLLLLLLFTAVVEPQWTHPRQFAIDSTSKFHVDSSSKLHRFWKTNPRRNYDIVSTWIRLSKLTEYRWVFHVDFSTSFLRRIDVTSVLAVSIVLFPNICSGNWYSAESMWIQQYWRNHWYWNYWN